MSRMKTRGCVTPRSAREVLRPGDRLGRASDQSRGKTTSDDLKPNRRVRLEEKTIVPAGLVQQSQWAGGVWKKSFSAGGRWVNPPRRQYPICETLPSLASSPVLYFLLPNSLLDFSRFLPCMPPLGRSCEGTLRKRRHTFAD
jgi:hypothetical protein